MKAPKMPKHTCPEIDKVKEAITNAQDLCRGNGDLDTKDLYEIIDEIFIFLDGESDRLEELREQNNKLRECAMYWQEQCEKLDSESSREIRDLKYRISNLEEFLEESKQDAATLFALVQKLESAT